MTEQVLVEPGWSERRPALALLGGLLAAVGVVAGLHATGGGSLSAPPVDPAGLAAWTARRDPVVAVVASVRVVVLAVGWYLLATLVLGVLARLCRSAQLVRLADLVTLRPVRRAISAALGMVLTAGIAAAQPASAAPTAAAPLPVELVLDVGRGASVTAPGTLGEHHGPRRPVPQDGSLVLEGPQPARPAPSDDEPHVSSGDASLHEAGEREAGEHETAEHETADREAGEHATAEHETADHETAEHEVEPGESFWSIAAAQLRADGAAVPDHQVRDYWLRLIDANRDRLLVADEPDLLYPGQRLLLPAVAPSVGR